MSALGESESLHTRVRAMIRAFERREPLPESFDSVAVDIARFQAAHVAGYRRLCAAHGVDPRAIERAHQAPAVPTDAFRVADVFAFDAAAAAVTFRTSGTTLGVQGAHSMRDVRTYDAAALAFGRAMLLRDLASPVAVLVVGPSPAESPDSSLAHMCGLFARDFGLTEPEDTTFFVRGGALDVAGLRERVTRLSPSWPAIVLATSFALVHLLDALGGEVVALPPRSRVMQTGGFKGRSREVDRAELEAAAARAFAIDRRSIVGEYGMTELSSQFWDVPPVVEGEPRVYLEPPWARVIPVDGETLTPVAHGEVGIARIEDLANVDSAFAVVTQDRVRRRGSGFELLGRMPDAVPRGCSIAVEEMLSAGPRRA